ncbi:hypothetical protein IAD21_01652 [Abditibacteriota bacterium]|nr:hypothetical protein IAD21_01652 [Abditibacteriota bacterium]
MAATQSKIAPRPLFRDPIFDGAADPVIVWNRSEKLWLMFYTNRRANVPDLEGVEWVHGTPLGIAQSSDGGATWNYRGTAQLGYGEGDYSYWAPDIVFHEGTYHMFLTFVPGMHTDWSGTRDIVHLTSSDLLGWQFQSVLDLSSDRVIDAGVLQLSDGTWRLWYNNETDRKSIYYADSPDLHEWRDKGKVESVSERPGEGPKVFFWKNSYWMIVDHWDGLGVYRSEDAHHWMAQAQPILREGGQGQDDGTRGHHADVIVSDDRVYIFYFTHPGRRGINADKDATEQRRSSIQVVELQYENGVISADRDALTFIDLKPPSE